MITLEGSVPQLTPFRFRQTELGKSSTGAILLV